MQQAEQGICKLTLCSCHTRGVLSRTLAGALVSQTPLLRLPEGSRQPEREISWLSRLGDKGLYFSRIACTLWAIHTVSHCCVAQ